MADCVDIAAKTVELLNHFSGRIRKETYEVYGVVDELSLKAFTKICELEISKALQTYYKEAYKTKPLLPYIAKVITYTALKNKVSSNYGLGKRAVYICPKCKDRGIYSITKEISGQILVCENCYKDKDPVFGQQSKKTIACPKCTKLIPINAFLGNDIDCPYGCGWRGSNKDLKLRLNKVCKTNVSVTEYEDYKHESNVAVIQHQDILSYSNEQYDKIISVIQSQRSRLELEPKEKCVKKKAMYNAFEKVLKKDTGAMMAYLMDSLNERPDIQSSIFQEFCDILENMLPFNIISYGFGPKPIEIFSLSDQALNVFQGESNFLSITNDNGIIKNNTKDIYKSGNVNYGPCFIGRLISVTGTNGEDYNGNIMRYSFSRIITNLSPGIEVKVKHLMIPSHYEVGSMILLQKVREKLVSSVVRKLNVKN